MPFPTDNLNMPSRSTTHIATGAFSTTGSGRDALGGQLSKLSKGEPIAGCTSDIGCLLTRVEQAYAEQILAGPLDEPIVMRIHDSRRAVWDKGSSRAMETGITTGSIRPEVSCMMASRDAMSSGWHPVSTSSTSGLILLIRFAPAGPHRVLTTAIPAPWTKWSWIPRAVAESLATTTTSIAEFAVGATPFPSAAIHAGAARPHIWDEAPRAASQADKILHAGRIFIREKLNLGDMWTRPNTPQETPCFWDDRSRCHSREATRRRAFSNGVFEIRVRYPGVTAREGRIRMSLPCPSGIRTPRLARSSSSSRFVAQDPVGSGKSLWFEKTCTLTLRGQTRASARTHAPSLKDQL